MGGAVSRFDETDWDTADGGMHSTEATLDGRPPTTCYSTYELLKQSVLAQQRSLDVTDSHANLLYEIRPVAKTLTAFDVYSGATQKHLLRVTTDLSRRYWVVYRVGVPTYEGQEPDPLLGDADATETEAQQEDGDEESSNGKNQFYKAVCVTVSWSRYMAVAAYYGEHTEEQVEEYDRRKRELSLEHQAIVDRQKSRDSAGESRIIDPEEPPEPNDRAVKSETGSNGKSEDLPSQQQIPDITASSTISSPLADPGCCVGPIFDTEEPSNLSDVTINQNGVSAIPEIKEVKSWFQRTSRGLQKQIVAQGQIYASGKEYLYKRSLEIKATSLQDPRKGVVHLDKPLLLCQEIYNKLIGNHQTSRVSKQDVVKLLRQDTEQHLQEGSEGRGSDMAMDDLSQSMRDDSDNLMVDAIQTDPDAEEASPQSLEQQKPLIGYWHWEHSMRTHKMKMHVAKGADLALHIVLAVLVNQVRYERNAIAMTV